jgi:uncharacterized short protein YbdD (DUF466 family)
MLPHPRSKLAELASALARGARLAVGLPDYETYLAHRRAHHPGEPAMSRAEFVRERMQARYGKGASRCC